MAAGQDRHQGVFHHAVLAKDHGGDRGFGGADLTGDLFGRADDHVLEFFDTVCSNAVCTTIICTKHVCTSHSSLLASNTACLKRYRLRCHAMNPMLNLCEGHVFVELNYPHIIGVSGY